LYTVRLAIRPTAAQNKRLAGKVTAAFATYRVGALSRTVHHNIIPAAKINSVSRRKRAVVGLNDHLG
jgi:hypothetical protein